MVSKAGLLVVQWIQLLVVAVLTTSVATTVFYPLYIDLSYFETDFLDYCVGVIAVDEKMISVPYKRSQVAALLPYWWSTSFGVINGIALASITSFALIYICCARWLWLFKESFQGQILLALLFVGAAPIVGITRMFNFYPEIILLCTFGSVLVAGAFHSNTRYNTVLGFLGAGICFLADVRGLVWGLWLVCCLIGLSMRTNDWKERGIRLGSGTVLLLLSWRFGRFAFQKFASPLTRQLDVRPLFNKVAPDNALYAPPYEYPSDFVWGHSNPLALMDSLVFLVQQAAIPVPEAYASAFPTYSATWLYWLFWLLCSAAAVAYLVWKRHWKELQLILPMVPFFLVYWKIPSMVEPHIRFFSQSLPVISVLLVAALVLWQSDRGIVVSFKKMLLLGGAVLSVAGVFRIDWPVSRTMMNNHLATVFPEKREQITALPVRSGKEIHLFVLPMTDRERRMVNQWSQLCEERLSSDRVALPLFEGLP